MFRFIIRYYQNSECPEEAETISDKKNRKKNFSKFEDIGMHCFNIMEL